MLFFTLMLAMTVSTTTPIEATPVVRDEPQPVIESIDDKITRYAQMYGVNVKLAKSIAYCESGKKQFEADGRLLRGKANSKDVGVFQVNEKYHLADSKRLGMDIYTVDGNIKYSMRLMSREGTTPWNASSNCW